MRSPVLLVGIAAMAAADTPPFSTSEMSTIRGFFLQNVDIQGSGGVVASPDPNTPGGSYYFHWARDGALTMNTVFSTWPAPNEGNVSAEQQSLDTYMQAYAQWVNNAHFAEQLNHMDTRIEPKFCLPGAPPQSDCPDGSVGKPYTGAWCRPQNDGPGLRAIALINYANSIMSSNKAFIAKELWTGNDGVLGGGAIKYDLEWVADNFDSNTCDLWEEIQSSDFFWNRFTMRKALVMGAEFAKAMGDDDASAYYTGAVDKLTPGLHAHYNGQFIQEASNRPKDASVICALNDGYSGDALFAPGDVEVANTIATLNDLFHSTFDINSGDDGRNVPGILYGRYEGDQYAGGNPWILTSGCLAELHYRGATDMATRFRNEAFGAEHAKAWDRALRSRNNATTMTALDSDSVQSYVQAMVETGDGILQRIRYHTQGDGFSMGEQLDKHTGFQISAKNLTWSYATVLKAMKARATAVDAMATGRADQ